MSGSRELKRLGAKVAELCLTMAMIGCTGSFRVATSGSPPARDARPAMCPPTSSGFRVETLDWDASVRRRFEQLAQRRGVVVRVADCRWTILESCSAQSSYAYRPVALQRDRANGSSNAGVSFGPSDVSASVTRSSDDMRDVATAGLFELQQPPSSGPLEGACEGATHVVTRYLTGAFRISMSTSRSGGLRIVYGGEADAVDRHASERQVGDPDACVHRENSLEPPADCSASIQLEIEPIHRVEPPGAVASPPQWNLATSAPADRCATGDTSVCRQECIAGSSSSCSRLAILCARGETWACVASAGARLNGWTAWFASKQ